MGYDDLEPEDLDFEISSLESELSTLEANQAIYGWGGGNEGFEMLAMDNDRRLNEVSSRLDNLRLSRRIHSDDD